MNNEIKIEVGQVWQNNDDPDEKRTVIAETYNTCLLAGYTEDEYWPNIWLRDSYILYRNADGTLASEQAMDELVAQAQELDMGYGKPEQVKSCDVDNCCNGFYYSKEGVPHICSKCNGTGVLPAQDTGSDGGLSERERFIAELSFKSGYESGHNDTVESQYGDSDEIATDMVQDMCLDGSYSDAPPPEPNHNKQVEVLAERLNLLWEYINGSPSGCNDMWDWFDSDGKAIIPDAEPEYCECHAKGLNPISAMFCNTCGKQIKEVSDE